MSDLKQSILFHHGQHINQIENMNNSSIMGITVGTGTDWDLTLAFESGLQIQIRIIGSFRSFEMLFHGIIYSSNYSQNKEV